MKRICSIVALAVLMGAAPAPMTLALHVIRNGFDLLDVAGIQLVVDNPSQSVRQLQFAQPQEFDVRITAADGTPIFTTPNPTPPPGVAIAGHTHPIQPGANIFTTYEWNELADTRNSPAAGTYRIDVRVLSAPQLHASTTIRFIPPAPVSAVAKLKPGDELTVLGSVDAMGAALTDPTGTVALSRHLAVGAGSTVVVRGSIAVDANGTRQLVVERWASVQASKPPG